MLDSYEIRCGDGTRGLLPNAKFHWYGRVTASAKLPKLEIVRTNFSLRVKSWRCAEKVNIGAELETFRVENFFLKISLLHSVSASTNCLMRLV